MRLNSRDSNVARLVAHSLYSEPSVILMFQGFPGIMMLTVQQVFRSSPGCRMIQTQNKPYGVRQEIPLKLTSSLARSAQPVQEKVSARRVAVAPSTTTTTTLPPSANNTSISMIVHPRVAECGPSKLSRTYCQKPTLARAARARSLPAETAGVIAQRSRLKTLNIENERVERRVKNRYVCTLP